MAILSFTERSIFFRIYAGLLFVCFMVAFFGYFLIQAINQQRLQSYRESVATIAFSLGTDVYNELSRSNKERWLLMISREFGSEIHVTPVDEVGFKGRELKRLAEGKSVVRYIDMTRQTMIYHAVDDGEHVLSVEFDRINERQVHATMMFLLRDLERYDTFDEKQEKLTELGEEFGYAMMLMSMADLGVDKEQFEKLMSGKTVLSFDNENQHPHLSVMAASDVPGEVVVVHVPLFNFSLEECLDCV